MIQVNGEPLEWHEGMTVRDVLTARKYAFPMLIITIDGTLAAREDYNRTCVPDGANLQVVHLMSGGWAPQFGFLIGRRLLLRLVPVPCGIWQARMI